MAAQVALVAEDDPDMLSVVAEQLRDEGVKTVHEAVDGGEALRLAKLHRPDLVVLDVMMPELSGWEVCKAIREDPTLVHTKVLMITGIGERLNDMTSPLHGADAHLDKPFESENLSAALDALFNEHPGQVEG